MADITSSRQKINDIEVGDEAPISEALFEKFGANINYLIDERDDIDGRVTVLEGGTTSNISSSITFSTSTGSFVTVTGSSISITPSKSGKVMLVLQADESTNISGFSGNSSRFRFKRGSTVITEFSPDGSSIEPGYCAVDLNAGTSAVTYTIEMRSGATFTASINAMKFAVYEI